MKARIISEKDTTFATAFISRCGMLLYMYDALRGHWNMIDLADGDIADVQQPTFETATPLFKGDKIEITF